ncbi:DNA alkylation repair protein [Aquirufa sp. ROCK-SH2]
MSIFINELEVAFHLLQNAENADWMTKYMRNQFPYLGIKKPERHAVFVDLYKKHGSKEDWWTVCNVLFAKKEREYQYVAMDFLQKKSKEWDERIPSLVESWILAQPWWDVVDVLSPKVLGPYFLRFPEQQTYWLTRWMESNNFWLQRACILFQLMYKSKTDRGLLSKIILELSSSKEFFIQKAIGWSLRQYARTDAPWVIDFVENHALAALSKREALLRV